MFILIPTSHDKMEVQRLPFITLGIAAVCILVHFITHFASGPSEQRMAATEKALVEFCVNNPQVELPEDVKKRLSQKSLDYLHQVGKYQEILGWKDPVVSGPDVAPQDPAVSDEEGAEEDGELSYQEEIKIDFEEKIKNFRNALTSNYFHRFGYIPAEGGFLKMITAMFIHGGWLHLIANMLFLYLAGCTIEDLWGRLAFPLLYFSGGIVATLAHAHMYPDSTIACVGASGAIAALMGAFMIRRYNARINFIWFALIGFRARSGRFKAPAYIMLPLWLLQQLFWGFLYSEHADGGGVAFFAHIGGFVFGALAALLLKVSGLEKKVIEPSVDKKSNLLDEDLSSGISKLEAGDANGAIFHLRKALAKNRDDVMTCGLLCRAYIKNGNMDLANREFKRSIHLLISQDDLQQAVEEYLELTKDHEALKLDPETEMTLMAAMPDFSKFNEAVWAYERFIKRNLETVAVREPAALLKAIIHCCHIYMNNLAGAKEAFYLLRHAVKSRYPFTTEQKNQMITLAKEAKVKAKREAEIQRQLGTPAAEAAPRAKTSSSPPPPPRPAAPSGKASVKLIRPVQRPPQLNVGAVIPLETGTLFPAPGGIDVKLMNHAPVLYENIHFLCAFTLSSGNTTGAMADVFVGETPRPYRIHSTRISYRDFMDKLEPNNADNFRKLLRQMISQTRSLFIDAGTLNFIKSGPMQNFRTEEDALGHEKNLWFQILNKKRSSK